MIKVSVFYPAAPGARFDQAYWLSKHIPLALRRFGSALRSHQIDIGLSGAAPGSPAPYVAIGNFVFDSVEAFQAAFGPHAPEIMGDIPNYTTITPVIQISTLEKSG
jgi:uncharacterized protein (TIGR02118 family)